MKGRDKMGKWIMLMARQVLTVATPEIAKTTCSMLDELEEKAKQTPNPWDDILVGTLKTILGCSKD